MSRKQSEEARIVNYFETATLDKVEVVFGIARGIMKRRASMAEADSPKQPIKRRTRKVKTLASPVETSAFEHGRAGL